MMPLFEPIKILVIDDHPFFREGLIAWIARRPEFRCCGTADTADTAFDRILLMRPHLVLLDLQLREGDGLELLRRLQELPLKPRVIVVSHKDQLIYAERALHAGAVGYVLKDEAVDTLATAIATVLDGGIHLSAVMNRRLFKSRAVAVSPPADRLRSLANRELQVLELLGQGRTTKEIAETLGLSAKTVEFYRESIKKKLDVPDSITLIRLATIWQEEGRWGLPASSAR